MENENRLPEDFKKRWVAALRSGDYKQGESQLHKDGTFCCLGVACLLSGYSIDDLGESCYPYNDNFPNVPVAIKGSAQMNGVVSLLAKMNDAVGGYTKHSFSEIADYIEKNL